VPSSSSQPSAGLSPAAVNTDTPGREAPAFPRAAGARAEHEAGRERRHSGPARPSRLPPVLQLQREPGRLQQSLCAAIGRSPSPSEAVARAGGDGGQRHGAEHRSRTAPPNRLSESGSAPRAARPRHGATRPAPPGTQGWRPTVRRAARAPGRREGGSAGRLHAAGPATPRQLRVYRG